MRFNGICGGVTPSYTRGACSCGNAEPHEIAQRHTADGIAICLWSDGDVTGRMGFGIKGVGHSHSAWENRKDVEAGWLMLGDVELYDFAEVPRLVQAARRGVRQLSLGALDYMRRSVAGERFQMSNRGAVIKREGLE